MRAMKTCLWYDGEAEEAARFYVGILPDASLDEVVRTPCDYPSGKEGDVLTVAFTLMGQPFLGLNGGPEFKFTEAISLMLPCETQAEVDHYWDALQADGGQPVQCGWLKDKYGLSWQVYPQALDRMIADSDRAAAKRAMEAMMTMVKIDLPTLERAFAGEAA